MAKRDWRYSQKDVTLREHRSHDKRLAKLEAIVRKLVKLAKGKTR